MHLVRICLLVLVGEVSEVDCSVGGRTQESLPLVPLKHQPIILQCDRAAVTHKTYSYRHLLTSILLVL